MTTQTVKIKPLVWIDEDGFSSAVSPIGIYQLKLGSQWRMFCNVQCSFVVAQRHFKALKNAKAAAQSHYENLIRECLE